MDRKVGDRGPGCRFWIRVRPRARRTGLRRTSAGEILFETTTPPVEGKANEALIAYLSRVLRVPRNAVAIRVGTTSRRKLIDIAGAESKEVTERLNTLLEFEEKLN